MGSATPARDDGLDRLEAFSSLLAAARGRLAAAQAEVDATVQDLEKLQGEAAARTSALAGALSAGPRDLLETSLKDTVASLAAVSTFAADSAAARLTDAQQALARLETSFDQGVAEAREGLVEASEQAATTLAGVQDGAAELHEGADEADQEIEALTLDVHGRLSAAAATVQQTGDELDGLLGETDVYVATGLGHYLETVCASFRAFVEHEVQPFLVGSLEALATHLAGCFDDFQASLETVATEVADTTVEALAEALGLVQKLSEQHEKAEERTASEGVAPLGDELARDQTAYTQGAGTAAELQPLTPVLVSARNVVHEIDDMMNFAIG